MSAPEFTVIIATYNWSSALAIAIQSVLDQSFQDFEVWIVGDACTDDSAVVVRSFADKRLNWFNLNRNCGSQWGPNRFGCSVARGRYIAYLGHDDVWSPHHLETVRACFENTQADLVAAGTLLSGPPHSGIRALTGFFPNGQFSPRHFFPPSSLAHKAHVTQTVGGWSGPAHAKVAVDYDFLYRCYQASLSFAMTGEVTVFKFNAAWSRDSYQRRDVSQQSACLAALQMDASTHLKSELTMALRAATEDRLLKIEAPLSTEIGATTGARWNQKFKGSHPKAYQVESIQLDGSASFAWTKGSEGFEWHDPETAPSCGAFRWSGPSTQSQIKLPISVNQPLDITLLVLNEIQAGTLDQVTLLVNGLPWQHNIHEDSDGRYLSIQVSPTQLPKNESELCLTLRIPKTWRPIDLGINGDRRWLGLAIGWIRVSPPQSSATV